VNDSDSSPSPTLAAALDKFGLDRPERLDTLDRYCHLLWQWNEKINLTRHTDYDKFVARDLVDAQQLSSLLQAGEDVLDVGSGGGVPGILLAILRDDLEVSLCDSVGKKAKVLGSIARELDLPCPVYAERAENVMLEMRYSTVTARAVGPLKKLLQWLEPCWHSAGRLLAVKGPRWAEEKAEAKHRGLMNDLKATLVGHYTTPGTDIENAILEVKPSTTRFVGNTRRRRK
jgi:16S rRNA (guanine527-N7)-methyltransferase